LNKILNISKPRSRALMEEGDEGRIQQKVPTRMFELVYKHIKSEQQKALFEYLLSSSSRRRRKKKNRWKKRAANTEITELIIDDVNSASVSRIQFHKFHKIIPIGIMTLRFRLLSQSKGNNCTILNSAPQRASGK
jgi:hypothetical protein